MFRPLLMGNKCENGQIVAYNDYGLSLHDIAKYWITIIFQLLFSSKILRKLEIIIKKKMMAARENPQDLMLIGYSTKY